MKPREKYVKIPKRINDILYKYLKRKFKNSSKNTQQKVLDILPCSVLRFDLASYFRKQHIKQ